MYKLIHRLKSFFGFNREPVSGIIKLYRPTGPQEFILIEQSGWMSFPLRLSHQPFFYPCASFEYAEKIARDWNSVDPDSMYTGYVIEFEVSKRVMERWSLQNAGGKTHQELWVPAEELEEFNKLILPYSMRLLATYKRGILVWQRKR